MKGKNKVYQSLVLVMQFGINMIVPILLCTLVGVWLGNRYDIDFIVIPLFFIGALAGFRNVFIMAKKVYDQDNKKIKDGKNVKKNQ